MLFSDLKDSISRSFLHANNCGPLSPADLFANVTKIKVPQ